MNLDNEKKDATLSREYSWFIDRGFTSKDG